MIYKIKFTEGDTINDSVEIEAENQSKAMVQFWLDHPEASDVSKVEKVTEEND